MSHLPQKSITAFTRLVNTVSPVPHRGTWGNQKDERDVSLALDAHGVLLQ
jgi:hypothetical protein